MESGFILYLTYEVREDTTVAQYYGRLDNGETFLIELPRKPYFYIRSSDEEIANEVINDLELASSELQTLNDEPTTKILVKKPRNVPGMRDKLHDNNVPTYEADIRFSYRQLIDQRLTTNITIQGEYTKGERVDRVYNNPELGVSKTQETNLKVLSFDIETNKQANKLWSVAIATSDGEEAAFIFGQESPNAQTCKDEKELLEELNKKVQSIDPDIITGWNVIDFDLDVLQKKYREHDIEFDWSRDKNRPVSLRVEKDFMRDSSADITGRVVLDGIHLLKWNFVDLDSYSLESAAERYTDQQKIFTGKNRYEQIRDSYKNNPEEFINYNFQDAKLVLEILNKSTTLELTKKRSGLTGLPLDRVKASIASLDMVYLPRLHARGYVAPTSGYARKDHGITGGFVMDSQPGIYDNILVLDFKSLYPSVMRTLNIDPLSYAPGVEQDTSDEHYVRAENGVCFKQEDGILPEILAELFKERQQATKQGDELARFAIKILMNSFFGVLASPNCRFFSMEVSNAITHTGQHLIKTTASRLREQGKQVIYGDSVTRERPLALRINGVVHIEPIEALFNSFKQHAYTRAEKEVIDLSSTGIESLSVDPNTKKPVFAPINEIIRHKTDKQIFRVNQKHGETRCTEDHSLIIEEDGKFIEKPPGKLHNTELAHLKEIPEVHSIQQIDIYAYIKDYMYIAEYKGRPKHAQVKCDEKHVWFGWTNRKNAVKMKRFISFPSRDADALLRLLGMYIAEGSSSTPETTNTRWGAMIAGDEEMLSQLHQDYVQLFENVSTKIIRSAQGVRTLTYETQQGSQTIQYEDLTHKLNMMNQLSAVLFKQLCGQRSEGKHLPPFIYHVDEHSQRVLLDAYLHGDGSRTTDERYSSKYLQKHFRFSTKSLQLVSGMSFLIKQLGYATSIRHNKRKDCYTLQTADSSNSRLATKIIKEDYDGYVYDLAIKDTHMFVDACGQILLHNTDSIFVDAKTTDSDEARKIGEEIQEETNAFFNEYAKNRYQRESYLELEFEKLYVRFLMPQTRSGAGSKKRYAGLLVEDGEERIDVTGLELVRRDWTDLAKDCQRELLNLVFKGEDPAKYIKNVVKQLRAGELDDKLVYTKALRKGLDAYTKTTPPHVKAARLIDGPLTTNLIEYVQTVDGPEPVGNVQHSLDYEHYVEKQLEPIADAILVFYGTNMSDVLRGTQQKGLMDF